MTISAPVGAARPDTDAARAGEIRVGDTVVGAVLGIVETEVLWRYIPAYIPMCE
jgi:hypothetical protein